MRPYYEIKPEDIGRAVLIVWGRPLNVMELGIGPLLLHDIGKRAFMTPGGWQVENNDQRDARHAGEVCLSANAAALYAINTGEFYPQHVRMGRDNAKPLQWMQHIYSNVLPRYGREIEPAWMTTAGLSGAANMLREYYERHAREMGNG
jgi:hypothetical protein